jgi:hypothetical protein
MPMLAWFLLALSCLTSSLNAQSDAATLRVLVLDPSDAAIANASVDLLSTGTNRSTRLAVNTEGYATFSPLLPGTYSLTATAPGFRQTQIRSIIINVAERRLLRVPLNLASTNESVDVIADAAVIQAEEASLGQVIKGEVAVELPLAGRRYTELAFLVPGASPGTANPITRGVGWFVSNGNFHTMNNFQIDGFDNNQGTFNMQSLSAQVVQPSPDALAEFKVQTNSYSAEFGRSSGAVINVSIKSGSNALHGSGWYYNRNEVFGANSWNGNLNGAEKAQLSWHQLGGTIGGKIKRDKLFYFGHYEGFVRLFGDNFLTTVPTADQRNGVFPFNIADPDGAAGSLFPNRSIPAGRFDPIGKKLLDLFPAANLPGVRNAAGRTTANYGVQRPGREDTHKFDIRKDWYATSKDRIFGRVSFLQQDIFRDPILDGPADGSGDQGRTFNRNLSIGMAWNRVVSPSLVNEFRAGYTRTNAFFTHATVDGISGTEFGFRGIPKDMQGTGGLPLIDFNNYNDLGTRNFRPNSQVPVQYQFLDTLSWVRGKHTIKAGFEFRWKRNDWLSITRRTPAYNVRGRFTNDDIGDLILGLPEQLLVNTTPLNETLQQVYAGFFQDDYKLSRNLTLNLGLRYEYATPFYGLSSNPNKNFDPRTGNLLRADDKDKYLTTTDRNNFGPRLGVAWQLRPERLVLRAAYGTFYSAEDFRGSDGSLTLNPPELVQAGLVVAGNRPPIKLSDPIPSTILSTANSSDVALRAREREQKSGTVHQGNIAIEAKLPLQSTLEVAFVANRGRNLLIEWAANQAPFGSDFGVAAQRPYPRWLGIQMTASRAYSDYNSLQAKWEKRFAQGWFALASYTYASALDVGGAWGVDDTTPQLRDNFGLERGPQAQIARHRFTLSNVAQLPFGRGRQFGKDWNRFTDAVLGGWQFSSIWTARTGLPVGIRLAESGVDPATGRAYRFFSRNVGGNSAIQLRPNRVGEPNTGISPAEDRLKFLNVSAFQVQAPNTIGNSARNVARGPSFFNVDVSLVKQFTWTDRLRTDLRLEAFNAFNKTNYGNPASTFGNANFGGIFSAGDPRVVQMAIRFAF